MRTFRNTINLGGIILLAMMSTAQAARHYSENNMPSVFTESNKPSFSGFYGNVGLAYNMMSSSVEYAGIVHTPNSDLLIPDTTANQSLGAVSGLFKVGYAFRFEPQFYVGVAAFYNLASLSTLATNNISYSATPGSGLVSGIDVKETAGSSYGFLLQPGYILPDNKSAVYLNLGMEMTSVTAETNVTDVNGAVPGTSLSSSKIASNVKLGVGYQRQMTFLKFKGARNLTWFVEDNYSPSTSVTFDQSNLYPALNPTRTEQIKASLGDNQLVLGVNYYF
jgi:hypothetical protein